MSGCRSADAPIEYNLKLGKNKGTLVDTTQYQKLVGKLIYLLYTQPDITFAVSLVSLFMHSPHEKHLEVVYRIIRYLKSTPGKGLLFKKNKQRGVKVYTDVDWTESITNRRSTSRYYTFVWGNMVTWKSKKQSVVAQSNVEAKFKTMTHGIRKMLWLKCVLEELRTSSSETVLSQQSNHQYCT